MKRFTNAKRSEYHHGTIVDFSDTSRLMTSGVARGYSSKSYSWLGDFLFKQSANRSLNPHIGYVSFFSDREIFHQEYGNVARIYNNYPFLSAYPRQALPTHSFELTSKQYAKTGQRGAEFDIVEYINATVFDLGTRADPLPSPYLVKHGYYRAPCFHAVGYRLDLEDGDPVWDLFDQYFWTHSWRTYSVIGEYECDIQLLSFLGEMTSGVGVDNDALPIIEDYELDPETLPVRRFVDFKFHIDQAKYLFFREAAHEWVGYYNEASHYLGQTFYPYVGAIAFFQKDWQEIHPFRSFWIDEYIAFFPEIVQDGLLEPAKIIVNWGVDSSAVKKTGPYMGKMVFNPANHLHEMDDQSRLVYNVCKYMATLNGTGDRFEIRRDGPDSSIVYAGIDIDTERNRRYSAVVMTEPYFVTTPLNNGTIVDYMFVDYSGAPVLFSGSTEFVANPAMYLRIKAPMSFIAELDRVLALQEYNTDIIDTFDVESPRTHTSEIATGPGYYSDFVTDADTFFRRQDDCLDDLVSAYGGSPTGGAIVGEGVHKEFWIDSVGDNAAKYSDDKMRVCGIGFICKTQIDSEQKILSTHDEFIRLYCTNYVARNCYAQGDSDATPLPNDVVEVVTDNSILAARRDGERFRPMIKLPGMNGYVKILERNKHFGVRRASDGQYEVTYNVEFPYCPGSYYERVRMAFTDYLKTQVLYKGSYINAGSWEAAEIVVDTIWRYDVANDRYVGYGNDSFNRHEILVPLQKSGLVQTNPASLGGGIDELVLSEKPRINYPASLVWQLFEWNMLSLVKAKDEAFRRYGTYKIQLWETPEEAVSDVLFSIGYTGTEENAASNINTASAILDQWIALQLHVNVTEAEFGSDLGSIAIYPNWVTTPDAPDHDLAAVRLHIPEDDYDFYIGQIEIYEDGSLVDSTNWESGWNGWEQISGTGINIVDSPSGVGKALLRTAESGDDQILQKVFGAQLDHTKPIRFVARIWYPDSPDFSLPAWPLANEFNMEIMPFTGRGYQSRFAPQNSPVDDHFIRSTTVTSTGDAVSNFSRDIKVFAIADNRQWAFGDDSLGSFIGRENPSYICEIDMAALLNDYTQYQRDHGSIPELKRWLYGYFSGLASTAQIPVQDSQSTDAATKQLGTLPGSPRDLPSGETESDIFIEVWDSESDIGNGYTGNWRPLVPARFDTLKVPGGMIFDGMYMRGDLGPTLIADIPGSDDDLYEIILGYYNEEGQDFKFPEWVDAGGPNDIMGGVENKVLVDNINQKWYHIAYMEYADISTVDYQYYRAIVRMKSTDVIPSWPSFDIPEELEQIGPLSIQHPRMQINKNPTSSLSTSQAIEGISSGVIGRYIDISGLVDALRSGGSASNRYVNENNNKIRFRVRVSRLKNRDAPTTSPPDPVQVNPSHDSDDASTIQYVGVRSKAGDVWFNYPWSVDGIVFDDGFDFEKVYPAELTKRLGMTYFKCASR